MSSAPRAPAAPRLAGSGSTPAGRTELTEQAIELVSDQAIIAACIPRPAWAATDSEFVELSQVRLDAGQLTDSQWYRTQWADVALHGADLANAVFVESGLRRVAVERARATGWSLAGCRVEDLQLTGSLGDYSNWRQASVNRARFLDCRLAGADFAEARLTDVDFVDCDLSTANFRSAQLQRVRFVRCRLDALSGVDSLAGTTIQTNDLIGLAGQFAQALEITLEPYSIDD